MEKERKCTCGPYPTIDITSIYYKNKEIQHDPSFDTKTMEELLTTCQSYGCFHLTIQTPPDNDNDKLAVFRSYQKENATKEDILELFQADFLEQCFNLDSQSETTEYNEEIDLNGMYILPYSNNCHSSEKIFSEVTFRGRNAESGDPKSAAASGAVKSSHILNQKLHLSTGAEPKQSWEWKRYSSNINSINTAKYTKPSPKCISKLEILQSWTNAFHSISTTLSNILKLPPSFLEHSTSPQKSNRDLLRVFRYDPLPSDKICNQHLGSSPHTDWGTMTIVWQDSMGGLQTYCHLHQCWNIVPPPPKLNEINGDEKDVLHFFVHVGDFTSLATFSKWPSPRHRVLCPNASQSNPDRIPSPRCSLVYFAYPKLGYSLADAQREFLKQYGQNQCNDYCIPFTHYSLLQNQSLEKSMIDVGYGNNLCIHESTYQQILSRGFDLVISDKWSQVQRG